MSVANSRAPQTLTELVEETGAQAVSVVDAARGNDVEGIEAGVTESRWVAEQLHRDVIKAFNNIYAAHLYANGKAPGSPGRIALPIAGDDAAAKATVMQLVDELGFDPIDAGTLDESWRQQPGSPVYVKDLSADGVRDALANARQKREPDRSGTAASPGSFEYPA